MELVNKKNTIIVLASLLVVALAVMALSARNKKPVVLTADQKLQKEVQQIKTQSNSDDVNSIQKDIDQTDLSNSDKELQNIDSELNKP